MARPKPHEELAALDPQLARLIEATDPKAVLGRLVDRDRDRFVALCRIIVGQQVSTAAARTIWGRVEEAFDGPPTPEQLIEPDAEERLRACGLSGRKASYAIGIAEAIVAEELLLDSFDSMSDDEVIEAVVALRGLGRWSAEMFLMFRLGRPDVLPVDDYSLRKAYATAFRKRKLPSPEALAKAGEKWRPYRTVASWYLWQTLNK